MALTPHTTENVQTEKLNSKIWKNLVKITGFDFLEEKIEMDFRLSPKTLSLLEEDEFDWTPPESKKMPTFAIFTPSTYEVRIKSKKPQVPLLKNLSLNKNRLHVKNLEFKTRLLHIYTEIDSLFHSKTNDIFRFHRILVRFVFVNFVL